MADTRSAFDSLASLYVPIAIVVVAIVWGAIGFAVWRYRDRGGHDPSPTTRNERPALEYPYAVVLALIAAGLAVFSLTSIDEEQSLADEPATEIEVTAFQWGWRFDYPGARSVIGDQRDIPELIVPSGVPVRFELTSRDVIHSFWIPEERFKRDAFPGRTTTFDLSFDAGPARGQCAEFCGLEHSYMDFEVRAVPEEVFDEWLASGDRP